ncbi:MAG TPA: polysaccharide biosynthesis tyrosine autokinase [Bryobacteraceae bacterium]|jgi:succinoglycan biosynthesis transport protein ExoP|nr:polysaccharide biosynthesis tyrosine autokinase [Bryobacteraceae bacterium]
MRNINGYTPEAKPKALPGKTGRWPVPYVITPNEPLEEAEITPVDYLHTLWRRKWTVGAFLAAGVLAGGILAYLSPRVYQGQTSIEVQDVNENFLNLKDIDPTATSSNFGNDAYVQTQAQILEQDALIEQVVKKLNLDQRPDFLPHSGLADRVRKLLALPPVPPQAPLTAAVQQAKQNLKIIPPRQGRIIEIVFDSTDPQLAADFPNALVEVFQAQNVESRWHAAEQVKQWLDPQLNDVKAQLDRDQAALTNYQRQAGLLITDGQENIAAQKLRLLQTSLAQAQADRIAKEPLYQLSSSGDSDGVAENPATAQYEMKLSDLRQKLAELKTIYTPENPKIVQLQAQITDMENLLKRQTATTHRRMQNDYAAAKEREDLLTKAYSAQAAVVAELGVKLDHYNALKHQLDTTRQVYDSMVQKVSEARVASAIRPTNVRVVGKAEPPAAPYKPNPPLNIAIGLFAGMICGIGCAMLLEQSNRSIRSPGEMVTISPLLTELGTIPQAPRLGAVSARLLRAAGKDARVERIAWEQKDSEFSESFRAVLASILLPSRNGESPRVFVVTSPRPGEGKTTVSSNLAIALAEIKHRVVLIDGDLRRPRLHDIFDVVNSSGFSDLLCEKESVLDLPMEQLVQRTSIPNLFLMPSGPCPDGIFNYLYSPRVVRLLDRLREDFDHVIIDAPPTLEFADARVMARSADGVILVFRANHTDRRTALAVVDQLVRDRIPILGTILNDWNPKSPGGYGDYAYRGRYGYATDETRVVLAHGVSQNQ